MRCAAARGFFGGAVLAATVLAVSAAPGPSAQAAGPATQTAVPLVSGVTTPALSSVALPMGNLAQPNNTFWELFLQLTPGSSWRLRTPPGVASNGGLAVAVSPEGPVTAGFLPSQLLHFSPVAQSSDEGTAWSPGFLPEALEAAPDALANAPAAAGAAPLTDAVVATSAGERVLTAEGVGAWHTLVTSKALAKTASGCTATRITAVAAVTGTSGPDLGVQCAQPGRIGVLVPPALGAPGASGSSAWSSVGPQLIGTATGIATVLRLEASGAGLIGLAAVRTGTVTALVAFWRSSPTASWSLSAPLRVPPGWTVRASATGGYVGQGEAVLLGSGAQLRVAEIAGPAEGWAMLSAPPFGTEALAVRGPLTDAFSVSGSKLRVWTSSVGATGWQLAQVSTVPVPYGSSS